MSDIKRSLSPIPEEPEYELVERADDGSIRICKEKLRQIIDCESRESYWIGFADGVILTLGAFTLAWIMGSKRITG